ncbi:DNA-binding response OmpR family regulator [Silvibacterium bohemicum]|uniref:DNA-binding response OmpR family regulator n=1 Tax=Silvibacterium bohemicum TaxID=1577686 RepID=A0A841JTY9_9BACT|nr:response regulator [Silvibacterium bohemicum]MBB6144620.1 DNA-binding response OmpR family regulator [Silvibacterium bohemicum]
MVRPCFLVIDPEFPGSISTRKLVIETAKFNVLTAYSGREAIETMRHFPLVSGVVLDADVRDLPCDALVSALKAINPVIPVIAISGPRGTRCTGADHHLESFDPRKLLEILSALYPEETTQIEKRNEELEREN